MKLNLIIKQLLCLLLLGAMSVSVAGNKKVLNKVAGKYDCNLGGSYSVDTGTVTTYQLAGNTALMRLPRGKGKGKAQFTIADILFNFKFKVTRIKVARNKKKIRYWGLGSIKNTEAGIDAEGTTRITARKKGRNWKVRSSAAMTGTYGPYPMEINSTIKGTQR